MIFRFGASVMPAVANCTNVEPDPSGATPVKSTSIYVPPKAGFEGFDYCKCVYDGMVKKVPFSDAKKFEDDQANAKKNADGTAGPRHHGYACPACQAAPPQGALWLCGKCRQRFDTFVTGAKCPHCGAEFTVTACVDCGRSSPWANWQVPPKLES